MPSASLPPMVIMRSWQRPAAILLPTGLGFIGRRSFLKLVIRKQLSDRGSEFSQINCLLILQWLLLIG